MSELDKVRRLVTKRVDHDHVNVLEDFLERINTPKPPPCSCSFNRALFAMELKKYVGLRLEIHKRVRHQRRVYGSSNYSLQHDTFLYSLFDEATIARRNIERFAPCPDCIVKLNPTNRKSLKPWNPYRKRAYKEIYQT